MLWRMPDNTKTPSTFVGEKYKYGKTQGIEAFNKERAAWAEGRKFCYYQHRLFCDEYQTYATLFGGNVTVDNAAAFLLLH